MTYKGVTYNPARLSHSGGDAAMKNKSPDNKQKEKNYDWNKH